MKNVGTGHVLIIAVLLTGCSSLPQGKRVDDYSSLPGSGDSMARGPGLLSGQHYTDLDGGGLLVYSSEESKNALIQPRLGSQQGAAQDSDQQPTATAARPTASSTSQQAEYQQFQEYQQFKQFQKMPESSPEHRRFREWQEWKQYQQWKNSGKRSQ